MAVGILSSGSGAVALPPLAPSAERLGDLWGSSSSLAVTVASSAEGETLLAVVGSTSRKPTGITQTGVTWTERYAGNGGSQYLTVYTGVVGAGGGGALATVAFGSAGAAQASLVRLPDESAVTSVSALATATATSASPRVAAGGLAEGDLLLLAAAAASPTWSFSSVAAPHAHVGGIGGQLRSFVARAVGPEVAWDGTYSGSCAWFAAILGLA